MTVCHCTHLKTASRKMAAIYDAALVPFGINIAQFSLLRNIARHQPVSLTELARALVLDRSTMGRNIRVLEKLGLAWTGRGEDQREAAVTLTGKGLAVLREAEPVWQECQDEIASRIGADRMQMLRELNELL
ncbi:MarR family transcriptional regulator [Acetobacteraceae bacterium H6797]|nr:MarR family transcriptional regulator [Acetobacteraceae bacterium H6797]